jgi:hypothetical protein
MVQYGYYNPFITWSKDKDDKWISDYTINSSKLPATLNRL